MENGWFYQWSTLLPQFTRTGMNFVFYILFGPYITIYVADIFESQLSANIEEVVYCELVGFWTNSRRGSQNDYPAHNYQVDTRRLHIIAILHLASHNLIPWHSTGIIYCVRKPSSAGRIIILSWNMDPTYWVSPGFPVFIEIRGLVFKKMTNSSRPWNPHYHWLSCVTINQ